MRQGFDGSWLFRLPYTAAGSADAFLFTFHLALGHLARITGLSLTTVYQAARILGGWALLVTVYAVIARAFDALIDRHRAWVFVALTSGLGWIGVNATDVTIPESNTFFSIVANAHFALAAALMLIIFVAVMDAGRRAWLPAALASLGLAILQPFAPIAVFAALGLFLVLRWRRPSSPAGAIPAAHRTRQAIIAVVAGLSIAPLMIYFYLVTQGDPILQGWSAQNLTPSPPLNEYLLGYGLMWVLALPGGRWALQRGRDVDLLLVAWAISSAVLLYAPFPLQRRFSLGLHIPIVLLALMGLMQTVVPRLRGGIRQWLPRAVLLLSLPSTVLLLVATSSAALRPPDARLFFSANESAAFDWLRHNVPRDAVVLAAPETGLFIPAWAGARVVYGHPLETVDAVRTKSRVEDFFTGTIDREGVIRNYGVDYIFFGPRERKLGTPDRDWQTVFTSGDVIVYRAP
jgi:hypothetical protein